MRPGRKRALAGWTLLLTGALLSAVTIASRWFIARATFCDATGRFCYVSINCSKGLVSFEHQRRSHQIRAEMAIFIAEEDTGIRQNETPELRWVLPKHNASPYEGSAPWRFGVLEIWPWRSMFVEAISITFAIWPLALLNIATGVTLVRSAGRARKRARTGLCSTCRYDRRGLTPQSPCPECGAKPT